MAKLIKFDIKAIEACYKQHKDDPQFQEMFAKIDKSYENSIIAKKYALYMVLHPENIPKKLLMNSDKMKIADYKIYQRVRPDDDRLHKYGMAKMPTYEELKAYEDDLKKRNMPPLNMDVDGNVDESDPYDFKRFYDMIEEQKNNQQSE